MIALVEGDRILTACGTGRVTSTSPHAVSVILDCGHTACVGHDQVKLLESPSRTVRATPGFVSAEYAERVGAAKRRGR